MPRSAPMFRLDHARKGTRRVDLNPDRQADRGLKTNSAAWIALRKQHLAQEPYCRRCWHEDGICVEGEEVDHIDGNSQNDDPSNHQTLCHVCHSKKTAREQGGVGQRKPRHAASQRRTA